MRLGITELILIIVLILLLFGGSKIPTIMENIGKGLKAFKKEVASSKDVKKTIKPAKTTKKKVSKKVSKSK